MSERGFTLVELLVASLVSMIVAAGALLLAEGARTALAVEPPAMDTVRRLREAVDAISGPLAGAGGDRGVGDSRGSLADALPVVRLTGADGEAFTGLMVTRAVSGGRGQLITDQPGPGGALTLADGVGLCPGGQGVCGFIAGDVAAVFDGRGHADVFVVGAVSDGLSRIIPRAPLDHAYRAGALVVEARQDQLFLAVQGDGSRTLTRITAAGAREPLVDGVTNLELRAWGRAAPPEIFVAGAERFASFGLPPPQAGEADPEGIFEAGAHCMAELVAAVPTSSLPALGGGDDGLAALSPAQFDDGPWCPHADHPTRYDADWHRLLRIDVRLTVEVLAAVFRGPAGTLFTRAGTATHQASLWVPDRTLSFAVTVRP